LEQSTRIIGSSPAWAFRNPQIHRVCSLFSLVSKTANSTLNLARRRCRGVTPGRECRAAVALCSRRMPTASPPVDEHAQRAQRHSSIDFTGSWRCFLKSKDVNPLKVPIPAHPRIGGSGSVAHASPGVPALATLTAKS